MLIETCLPPRQLAVSMKDDYGDWHLTGPGWEYYLDMLIASRNGDPMPKFDDYYPAQRDYFVAQLANQ